jgi:hypothetical protein
MVVWCCHGTRHEPSAGASRHTNHDDHRGPDDDNHHDGVGIHDNNRSGRNGNDYVDGT